MEMYSQGVECWKSMDRAPEHTVRMLHHLQTGLRSWPLLAVRWTHRHRRLHFHCCMWPASGIMDAHAVTWKLWSRANRRLTIICLYPASLAARLTQRCQCLHVEIIKSHALCGSHILEPFESLSLLPCKADWDFCEGIFPDEDLT